jgi:hypothetical protein
MPRATLFFRGGGGTWVRLWHRYRQDVCLARASAPANPPTGLQSRGPHNTQQRSADDLGALIMSPTREWAEPIAKEELAENTGVIVRRAVGGTRKRQTLGDVRILPSSRGQSRSSPRYPV